MRSYLQVFCVYSSAASFRGRSRYRVHYDESYTFAAYKSILSINPMAADPSILSPFSLVKNVSDFFVFWYWKSSKDFWHRETRFIKGVERDIGILINLKMILEPIFSDYTFAGRLIGPFFRLFRVLLGCVCVVFFSCLIVVIYGLWLILPPVTLVMILKNIFYILVG